MFYLKIARSRPPATHVCLAAWEAWGASGPGCAIAVSDAPSGWTGSRRSGGVASIGELEQMRKGGGLGLCAGLQAQ